MESVQRAALRTRPMVLPRSFGSNKLLQQLQLDHRQGSDDIPRTVHQQCHTGYLNHI